MGAPIAGHLLAAGTPVAVFDPAPAAVEALVRRGATAAPDAAAVAARSDVVLVVVVDDDQVREVVTGERGVLAGAAPGTVVAVCASVRPDTCRELARAGTERG